VSSAGVIPSAKHFTLNEFETNRQGSSGGGGGGGGGGAPPTKRQSSNTTTDSNSTSTSSDGYNVIINDRAFHETYLAPFYDTVKNGIGGAMCTMNRVNGTYACESQGLLGDILKVELGFPGIVHADAGAQKSAVNSAVAGMDFSSGSTRSNSSLGASLSNYCRC
jgi:beta-glucosidase